MTTQQNKSFSVTSGWISAASLLLVSTATAQLCEDASLGGKSRSALHGAERNGKIKNNKTQCVTAVSS